MKKTLTIIGIFLLFLITTTGCNKKEYTELSQKNLKNDEYLNYNQEFADKGFLYKFIDPEEIKEKIGVEKIGNDTLIKIKTNYTCGTHIKIKNIKIGDIYYLDSAGGYKDFEKIKEQGKIYIEAVEKGEAKKCGSFPEGIAIVVKGAYRQNNLTTDNIHFNQIKEFDGILYDEPSNFGNTNTSFLIAYSVEDCIFFELNTQKTNCDYERDSLIIQNNNIELKEGKATDCVFSASPYSKAGKICGFAEGEYDLKAYGFLKKVIVDHQPIKSQNRLDLLDALFEACHNKDNSVCQKIDDEIIKFQCLEIAQGNAEFFPCDYMLNKKYIEDYNQCNDAMLRCQNINPSTG